MPQRLISHGFWVKHRGTIGYLILVGVVLYLFHAQQVTSDDTHRLAAAAARQAKLGAQAHQGDCALRDDLRRRVAESLQFLATHPRGIPGIPAKTIRLTVSNEQHTIRTLRVLRCS